MKWLEWVANEEWCRRVVIWPRFSQGYKVTVITDKCFYGYDDREFQ